jgi:hypothetical protein
MRAAGAADDARSRDPRPQRSADRDPGLRSADTVTLHEEETLTTEAGTIAVLPAWRWLLEDQA